MMGFIWNRCVEEGKPLIFYFEVSLSIVHSLIILKLKFICVITEKMLYLCIESMYRIYELISH